VKASTIAAVVALVAGACSSTPAGSAAASGSVAPSTSAAASGSAAPSGSAAAGGTINVGGGFALTGIEASLDVPAANGAKLAVKEINGASGVLGKQINLIIHDSQYKADITTQNAKQFVEQDKVPLMIGYTDSDSVLQTGPTMQKAKVPFITVGATSPRLPTQIGDMMFLACFGDNVQAAVGAEYSFDKFGKNAYFLWDKGVEYTTLLGQYFKSRFSELGGKLLLEDSYDDAATDFSAQIAKIKALPTKPDFYYIAAMPYNVGPVVKQFRDAGLDGPIVGGDGYDTPDLLTVAGAAANNVFFTTHALMDATGGTDGIKKFIASYKAEYGHDPENAFAALGYDTVYLLADAVKRAGGTDSAAVKTALEGTRDFKGITGSVTFSADSHVPQKGVTMIAVKDGKFTLGAEVVPVKVPAP
jgi:branched-chain amino acid transport system substrate-binding protein